MLRLWSVYYFFFIRIFWYSWFSSFYTNRRRSDKFEWVVLMLALIKFCKRSLIYIWSNLRLARNILECPNSITLSMIFYFLDFLDFWSSYFYVGLFGWCLQKETLSGVWIDWILFWICFWSHSLFLKWLMLNLSESF